MPKKNVTALGYSSIVALAQNNGIVNAKGNIIAKMGQLQQMLQQNHIYTII